ncbi:energy transducer TonB [Hoylesella nanceiensis]|uniref:energy transducer TonB n=1 Tax=Hoylesella nanceiensis TaxID=425941 RepID=UPI001CAF2BD1|nr:energy transducer TonB [Hoylesella nanceiensis]MBF1439231.1 energy transducer TonB [Hoylesella nanceiensis]
MKRINYTLVLIGLALTTLLFFSSMKKIGDIKDKFDESEQVENGVIGGDSFAHASETEKVTSAVKNTAEIGEKAVESSDPKKVFTGKVYDLVDEMPSFPGGLEELYKWIDNNVQYPAVARENGIEGRVILKFIVEKDGSLSDSTVIHSVHPMVDREALRLVGQMPKWNPGKRAGVPVRVRYCLPIKFKLGETKPSEKK